ncbi:unnamed protein product [Paramecium sonneborni]|uniref:Uncharacterized protein n=1 Tax=Paramecium sonneborni TaxID=65129 RepID=A0A8S1LHD6_9CILI|nr:unnamed protein product [Paramecium sonneborni]
MNQEADPEFTFSGVINKESKKIYDGLMKIKRNDPFYICVTNKIDFLSIGRTNSHHFTLQVEKIKTNQPMIIERIDLEAFKQALSLFRMDMQYQISFVNYQLCIKTQIEENTQMNTYQCKSNCKIPILVNCDKEQVKMLLNLQIQNTLVHLEFSDCDSFRLISQQYKALKLHRIQFEIIPEQTQLRLQTYFETDYSMIMKYHFNNFKILDKNIIEKEKFTYNSDEFVDSISMLDKDSTLTFLLTNNGTLLIGVLGGQVYSTKSLLSRIIVHDDY